MFLNYISHPTLSPYHTSLLLPPHTFSLSLSLPTIYLSPLLPICLPPLSHLYLTPTLCHTPLSHPNSLNPTPHFPKPLSPSLTSHSLSPSHTPLSHSHTPLTLPFQPTPPLTPTLFNTYILLSLPPQSHSSFPSLTPHSLSPSPYSLYPSHTSNVPHCPSYPTLSLLLTPHTLSLPLTPFPLSLSSTPLSLSHPTP